MQLKNGLLQVDAEACLPYTAAAMTERIWNTSAVSAMKRK